MRTHLVELLDETLRAQNLRSLQNPHHQANCPSVAAAKLAYLRAGVANTAIGSLTGGFFCTAPTRTTRNIADFVSTIRHAAEETCAVVGAFGPPRQAGGPPREHYFALIRLNRTVYYVDAYTVPGVVTSNVSGYTRWANRFEYFPDFVCTLATPPATSAP